MCGGVGVAHVQVSFGYFDNSYEGKSLKDLYIF